MAMLKASIAYFVSLMASKILLMMTPIEFTDTCSGSTYKTMVDKGILSFEVEVTQWCMCSKTRYSVFNSCTRYYTANLDLLEEGKIVGKREYFFPEPIRGWFRRTKLPHAIIALAALDKVQVNVAKAA